jgi:hypothetical protein
MGNIFSAVTGTISGVVSDIFDGSSSSQPSPPLKFMDITVFNDPIINLQRLLFPGGRKIKRF